MLIVLMPERLPAAGQDAAPLPWWQLDGDGMVAACGCDTLVLLGQKYPGMPLRLLAPAGSVALLRVDLPSRRPAAIRAALPYALEEQLSQELDEVHLVAGPRREDGRLLAAVVDRQLLQGWLELVTRAGMRATALVPVALLFERWREPQQLVLLPANWPQAEGALLALVPGQEAQLVESSLLGLWLPRTLAQLGEPAPGVVALGCDLSAAGLPAGVSLQQQTAVDMQHWLQPMRNKVPLNLLTGDFAVREQSASWQRLRPLAWVAVLLLALGWLQLAAETWLLERQRMQTADAIDALFDTTLPGSTRVMPVEQFRQLLGASASNSQSKPGMGNLLYDVLDTLRQQPRVTLKQLRASGSELEMELELGSYAELEALREALAGRGTLQEQLQGADSAGESVSARLRVSRRGT